MNQSVLQTENNKLRHELIQSRNQVVDLQEDLKEKTNLYMNMLSERNLLQKRLDNSKSAISRVDQIVESNVNAVLQKERAEFIKVKEENALLKQRIELMDQERESMGDREKQLMDKIQGLSSDLAFYARNIDTKENMKRIEALREEKDAKERIIMKLNSDLNDLSNKLEDFMAENSVLRKMANVPKNYGINREQVKLHDKEKIDDYKKLIRVLQDDNYKLEEERAKLKHKLKQQSMMYSQQPSQRYKGLSQEQIFQVDQFVLRLLSGDSAEPADFYKLKKENQNLKAQLEALNKQGFDFIHKQLEQFFKDKSGLFGGDSKTLQQLLNGNDDIFKMLQKLLQSGIQTGSTIGTGEQQSNFHQKFRPPQPQWNYDGEINNGFSYKFDTHLDVFDKNGKQGLSEANRYDVAFLQLQLVECFEIIKRKDDSLETQQNEIDILYKRVRDYLLVQDLLYKDYIKMEKDFEGKKEQREMELRNTRDLLIEEQTKNKNYEHLISTLNIKDRNTIEFRLLELTKQCSLMDINLLRLTRKYTTLSEQEALLRREYHNKEADMAEKDRFVQDRINKLKEWKSRAIQQLKFLFQKLRCAVPLSEYQNCSGEMESYKQKTADLIDRNCKFAQKMSKLQKQVREGLESQEQIRQLKEEKEDIESEFEILSKRLSQFDQNYRWEVAIFNKIVTILKRVNVSPQRAFEEFDINKDGSLSRQEFIRGMEMMKIDDLSGNEIDILINSLDVDSDGHINYKEFVKKLARHGIRNKTSEEQIIQLIIESLKRSNIKSLSDAFELLDKESDGYISRDDFKDIFKNLNLKVSTDDIEKFVDQFWKDKHGGIDYQQFLRIFNRYQVRLDEQQNPSAKKTIPTIPEHIIRIKQKIFKELNLAFQKTGKSLRALFQSIDVDQSNEIDQKEFKAMFQKMRIQMSEIESDHIFNSIDFDLSGKITLPEFQADFDHYVQSDIDTLIREEKEKARSNGGNDKQSLREKEREEKLNEDLMRGMPQLTSQNMESHYKTRIAILESREKQFARKYETAMRILGHSDQGKLEAQQNYEMLEKKWNEISEQYHIQRETIREMEEKLRQSINRNDAERVQNQNEFLRTEVTETKAALLSYKSMCEVVSDQVKGLKLTLERKKDENENLVTAIRDLQSLSIDQQKIGKLYYIIMLSRWQEAAVNKKYDLILTENKELRKELMNSEQICQNKEYDHHNAECSLQEKSLIVEQLKQKLATQKGWFLSLEKAEEMNAIIQVLSDDKSEMEEEYFKLRSISFTLQLRMDEAVVKYQNIQEVLDVLQKSKQSEISDKIIEVSGKIQEIRLKELRASREANELKERNTYISKLLKQNIDSVKKYEEQVADYESKMHKREEEFRRADNVRMKRFFQARFDDNNSIGGSGGGGGGMGDLRSSNTHPFKPSGYNSSSVLDNNFQGNTAQQKEENIKQLEGQVKRLKEELKQAVDEIRLKDQTLKRFKEWQLDDQYLGQDTQLKDAIDSHKVRQDNMHEKESKEMAEAAYVTIKTLQDMLDQKNQQLKNKEDMITKYIQQLTDQKECDQLIIAQLQQKLSLTGGTALNKLHELVAKEGAGGDGHNQVNYSRRYDRLTREELQRTLDEKDHVIKQLEHEKLGLIEEKKGVLVKKQSIMDRLQELEYENDSLRQQNEVKANRKEIERLRRDLKEKDMKNDQLKRCIDELGERMTTYEIKLSNTGEEDKIRKIQDDTKKTEHQREVDQMKQKMRLMETQRNMRADELKQMKIEKQEKEDKEKNLQNDKTELQKALNQTREKLNQEMKLRQQMQIEINALRSQQNIGHDLRDPKVSYEYLMQKNNELEKDIIILQCKQKTCVAYNKELQTFEYIGEPILLSVFNNKQEIGDLDTLIGCIQKWLEQNPRLTCSAIFQSLDKQNFGELKIQQFTLAFEKIGIKLKQNEIILLKDVLDIRNIGYLKYRQLIRQLSSIQSVEFQFREVLKLSKMVESRDLLDDKFKMLIDPQRKENLSLQEFQVACKEMKNENFMMSEQEIETLFKYMTKSQRSVGINISIDSLKNKVYNGLQAILIDQIIDALFKSQKLLQDIFTKHDTNKDGFLEVREFENMLLDCSIAFKPNIFSYLVNFLDENNHKKVSYTILKHYILIGQNQIYSQSLQHLDVEPQLLSDEIINEEMSLCKSAAKKILNKFQGMFLEELQKKDLYKDGIISREDFQKVLDQHSIQELTPAELNLLLKYLDKGYKGYLCIQNTLEKMFELAQESKGDTVLRRFANIVKHQGINLKSELNKFDTSKKQTLDKKQFERCLRQLNMALNDEEINVLYQNGMNNNGAFDIKNFLNKVQIILKSKPLPSFINQQPPSKLQPNSQQIQKEGSGGAFEIWDMEKKNKKKLEALQQQIEESKRETQAAEKQSKHWQEMSNKLEKEKVQLQSRLIDLNAKAPRAAQNESQALSQVESIQQLKDQLFYFQEENHKLERTINVHLKGEMSHIVKEKEKLQEKLNRSQDAKERAEYQLERLLNKQSKGDKIEQREEFILFRDNQIKELEKEIQERVKNEDLQIEQVFKLEEQLLELKFQKETFDLQYSRLQKRITDLENYKLQSAQYSSTVIKKNADEEKRKLDDIISGNQEQKKNQDSIKIRQKTSKSVLELETIIEAMKRVIEKQNTEIEQYKRKVAELERQQEKRLNEKQLRQQINNLEEIVHHHEMKELNVEQKDVTIKKLVASNKIMKEDLDEAWDKNTNMKKVITIFQ